MPILVKSDDVRSGRKAKGRHGPLWRLGSQWVKKHLIFGDVTCSGKVWGNGRLCMQGKCCYVLYLRLISFRLLHLR